MSGEVSGSDVLRRTSRQNFHGKWAAVDVLLWQHWWGWRTACGTDNIGAPLTDSICLGGQSVRNFLGQVTVLLCSESVVSALRTGQLQWIGSCENAQGHSPIRLRALRRMDGGSAPGCWVHLML